jgi:hypothetical protein
MMRFIVRARAIDAPMAPPDQALSAFKASFQMVSSGQLPAIKEAFPHADERATTFLVEVETAEELSRLLTALPGFWLSSWEAHPVTTVEEILQELETAELQMRQMRGGGT